MATTSPNNLHHGHRKDMQSTMMLQQPWLQQAQTIVHFMFAELQLQARGLHGVVLWHPHFIRRSTISGTSSTLSGRVTGWRDLFWSSFTQPYSIQSNSFGLCASSDCHTKAWWWTLLTCSLNASVVGGKLHNFGVDDPVPVFDSHTFNLVSDILLQCVFHSTRNEGVP